MTTGIEVFVFPVVTETRPQHHREVVMWNKGNKLNCNCNGLLFLNLYPTTFHFLRGRRTLTPLNQEKNKGKGFGLRKVQSDFCFYIRRQQNRHIFS